MQAADFAAGRQRVLARSEYAESAKAIASRLHKAEASLEASALDLNELHTGLIEGRRASGLSTVVGHDLLEETVQAQLAVSNALSAIVRVHAAAGRQVKELGLTKMDFGMGGAKPNVVGSDPLTGG